MKTSWTIMPDTERSVLRIRAQIVGPIRKTGSVQPDVTARVVLRALIGREIPIVTGRPNRILQLDDDVIVAWGGRLPEHPCPSR